MLRIWVDKSIRKIRIQTDDPSVKILLEVRQKETKYIPWQKKWGTIATNHKLYDDKKIVQDSNGLYNFTIGIGWAGYLINMFKKYMSPDDYNNILKDAIYSDLSRDIPFAELKDYQNEDILHILKYRVGLVCVYTSYGELKLIYKTK